MREGGRGLDGNPEGTEPIEASIGQEQSGDRRRQITDGYSHGESDGLEKLFGKAT